MFCDIAGFLLCTRSTNDQALRPRAKIRFSTPTYFPLHFEIGCRTRSQ